MAAGWVSLEFMFFHKPLTAAAAAASLFAIACPQWVLALDRTAYCNAVQNRVGFIRYPLGTIAAWSTPAGESADVMTRVPRVYPCLNAVVAKGAKEDWRESITGDPSMLSILYRTNKPAGATTVAITVSPHTAVYQVTFPSGAGKKYLVFDFGKGTVDDWAALSKWTERTVTRVDSRRFKAVIGESGKNGAFYALKFSAPSMGSGTLDGAGSSTEGATNISGVGAAMYAQFDAPTVTVTIAESFSGMNQAEEFLAAEGGNFETVHGRCHAAWEQALARVELEGTENSKRMAYTALYTMYANIINGDDGSCYLKYYPRPRSLASSAYWQFIGGFQSCCWDNFRAAYPALMLAYPEVMSDVVNTYLARYQRDGCVDGNICLFTGPAGGHRNVRFSPVLVAQAWQSGIAADYSNLYAALKDNFNNDALVPATLSTLGYETQPPSGGKACSETLELATSMASMAMLAQANHDEPAATKYEKLSKCYTNLWDSTNLVFRVRNADGSWGVINNTNWTWNPNPQGLFEGTTQDWMFSIPHDPYGLLELPGQERFVERVKRYCVDDTWFNDYQYNYPFMLYYAGAPNECQQILRKWWIPMFHEGVMFEGVRPKPPHNGWQTHYTSNSGWLLLSMLGLYPVQAPVGQFIISSPSLSKAVIQHGAKKITVEARNGSGDNIYIRSVKLDGKVYPSYMIAARRLVAGARLELEMGSDPAQGLGPLYLGSSDGWVLDAALVSALHLKCTVEAPVSGATSKIFCATKPTKVLVDGREAAKWAYDAAGKTATVFTTGTAAIEVSME
jgi:predicted alpha-1,2-mannosidase